MAVGLGQQAQEEPIATTSDSRPAVEEAGPTSPHGLPEVEEENLGDDGFPTDDDSMSPSDDEPEDQARVSKSVLDYSEPYPSDPFLFQNETLSTEKIRALVQHGPCQPGLKDTFTDFVTSADTDNDKFKVSWYKNTSGRCTVDRQWLVYSPKSCRMFCSCCWLFAEKGDQTIWSDPKKGFYMFHKGSDRIKHHENTAAHRKAEKSYFLAKYRITEDKTVIAGLMRAECLAIERKRKVLTRLVDASLFLAKQGIPFRGHREYAGLGAPATNEGNFLELLKLIAKYDSILDSHLNEKADSTMTYKYISPESQNELISSLGAETLNMIVKEIKDAVFYSVIVDSTIDIARVDQFSLSIRYVDKSGKSVERFIKFEELSSGSSAEAFHDLLILALREQGLDLTKVRGQAYDGARNMSGHLSGLQKRVKDTCSSKALYVHCCAHNLNLILLDAATSCKSGKLFFGTLETLYCFLTSSLPRYKILAEEQEKLIQNTVLTLKRLSDTRWASRKQATEAVLKSMPAIIEALYRISDHERTSPKALAEAQGLLTTLETFEFMFMLHFWNNVLGQTFILSNYLQKESIDLNAALELIDKCATNLKRLRSEEGFANIETSAREKARESETSTEFQEERVRKRKRFADEIAPDEPINDSRTRFKVESFYYILDVFDQQFETRFTDFRKIAGQFQVLNERHFFNTDSVDKLNDLAQFYSDDVDVDNITDEYRSFRDIYKGLFPEGGQLTTGQILSFLVANDMHRAFPNLATLYRIYLTIPISSAQAERTFSRLKLIKSYLRSTMTEKRLSNLAMLYIERAVTERVDFNNVIETFARIKNRRTKFT